MTRFNIPLPRTLIITNVILILLFWMAFPPYLSDWHAIIIQSARAALSAMVVVTYGYAIYEIRNARDPNPSYVLIVGIFLAFLADAFGAALSIYWRWIGKPIDMAYHQYWAFGPYLTSIAAIHHVIGPGSVDGRIPKRNMIIAGGGVAIAVLVAGLIIGFHLRDIVGMTYPNP